jgi:hypothetical protein
MVQFHRYSVANMFLIAAQRPTATQVAGYRSWQKLGRQVKQGEQGIATMAPVIYRKKTPANDKNKGENEEDEILATFKTAHIFDVSQTEGKASPELAHVVGNPVEYLPRRFLADYIDLNTWQGLGCDYTGEYSRIATFHRRRHLQSWRRTSDSIIANFFLRNYLRLIVTR